MAGQTIRPPSPGLGAAFFAERKMVGVTGLEPVTLRLSSACSNQLSYTPNKPGLPSRSSERCRCRGPVGPPSLSLRRGSLALASLRAKAGGAEGIRTPDLQLAKLPLYQLSYSPTRQCGNLSADCGIKCSAFRTPLSALVRVRSLPLVCSKSGLPLKTELCD